MDSLAEAKLRRPELAACWLVFIALLGEGVVPRTAKSHAALCSTGGKQERASMGNGGMTEGGGWVVPGLRLATRLGLEHYAIPGS